MSITNLSRCPNCGKPTYLDNGVHFCGTASYFVKPETTIDELLVRIETLERNYRELLKALRRDENEH